MERGSFGQLLDMLLQEEFARLERKVDERFREFNAQVEGAIRAITSIELKVQDPEARKQIEGLFTQLRVAKESIDKALSEFEEGLIGIRRLTEELKEKHVSLSEYAKKLKEYTDENLANIERAFGDVRKSFELIREELHGKEGLFYQVALANKKVDRLDEIVASFQEKVFGAGGLYSVVEELVHSNNEIVNILDEYRSKIVLVEKLVLQVQEHEKQVLELKERLQEEKQRRAELEKEVSELRFRVVEFQHQVHSLEEKVQLLEGALQEERAFSQSLANSLGEAKKMVETMKGEVNNLTAQLQSFKLRQTDVLADIRKLQENLSRVFEKITELEDRQIKEGTKEKPKKEEIRKGKHDFPGS